VRKTYKPQQIINKLREVEVHINQGISVSEASRKIGVTEQTYYRWRKEYGSGYLAYNPEHGPYCSVAYRPGIRLDSDHV